MLVPKKISKMKMIFKRFQQGGRFEYRIPSKGQALAFTEWEVITNFWAITSKKKKRKPDARTVWHLTIDIDNAN